MNNSIKKSLKSIPFDVGPIHFVGIGGIGMSGIAEILYNLGYKITGSDLSENANVSRLRKMGIEVFQGHSSKNIGSAFAVVKSTAVSMANPEIVAAQQKSVPVVRRSEMLAELTKLKSTIAISGSHGKTTTTSIIAHIFEQAGLQPTIINGGIINTIGSNAKLGKGDWLIAEADESDGTFVKIPAAIGVVTNLDPEHLDYWKSFDALKEAFVNFLKQLPFYGFGVLNYDHPLVRELISKVDDRKIYTYSMESEDADIYASNFSLEKNKSKFDVTISKSLTKTGKQIKRKFEIPCFGEHNISNSLAAILSSIGAGIEIDEIQKALKTFEGVKRRFTIVDTVKDITIIDDYAHHPEEIKATIASAKQFAKGNRSRVVAVMQPHRYTRLENLFIDFANSFEDADLAIITEIYAAGESKIGQLTNFTLVDALKRNNIKATGLKKDEDLPRELTKYLQKGDIVVCMGAGSITNMAYELPEQLEFLL